MFEIHCQSEEKAVPPFSTIGEAMEAAYEMSDDFGEECTVWCDGTVVAKVRAGSALTGFPFKNEHGN
jgi:hypothetical protein